jgi:hypothetical protein
VLYVLVEGVEQKDAITDAVEVMMIHGVGQMMRMFPPMIASFGAHRNGLVYVALLLQIFRDIMNTELRQILGVGLPHILFHGITIGRAVSLAVITPRHIIMAISYIKIIVLNFGWRQLIIFNVVQFDGFSNVQEMRDLLQVTQDIVKLVKKVDAEIKHIHVLMGVNLLQLDPDHQLQLNQRFKQSQDLQLQQHRNQVHSLVQLYFRRRRIYRQDCF